MHALRISRYRVYQHRHIDRIALQRRARTSFERMHRRDDALRDSGCEAGTEVTDHVQPHGMHHRPN